MADSEYASADAVRGLHILFVEDDALDAELCEHELRRGGLTFTTRRVCTRAGLTGELAGRLPDVVLSDFSMPTDLDGFTALQMTRARSPDVPFIFVSGTIGEERAVAALRAGATDYVLKDRLERLPPVVRRALDETRAKRAAHAAERALRESESRFRSFMEHLPGNASICDAEGRYTYVNELWERTFGIPAAAALGRRYDDVRTPYMDDMADAHREVLRTHSPVLRVTRSGPEGDARWWLAHHFRVLSQTDGAPMLGTIAVDVTERTLQEEKIARLSRIHAVLGGINSAIVRLRDTRELLAEACRIAKEHGGFGTAWIGLFDETTSDVTPVASAGLNPGEDMTLSALVINGAPRAGGVVHTMLSTRQPALCNDVLADIDQRHERRREAARRGYRSLIALPLIVGGRLTAAFCLYSKEINAFNAEEVRLLMQLASDVAFALEYIENERRLTYLAQHDPVTGLANRARLHEQLQYALDAAEPEGSSVAVVVWDIKRFRVINNTFGRAAGDELLRIVADKMSTALPRVEQVARLSADCFGAFVTRVTRASVVAQWLAEATNVLAEPVLLNGTELLIGVAAGIALFPADGRDAESLLANAEAALKQAKVRAEPYAFYEAAMNAQVAEKLTLESRLRRALDKDQFVLHYQPKVDAATGERKGVEALIRWNDPGSGLMPPGQFIGLLEETGLILDVGMWAIRRALDDWRHRTRQGLPTPRVAVNVSAIQLRRPEFVDVLKDALGGSQAHGLDLEITESLLMEGIEANISKLRAIKDLGINIAIDDFGTGYSSLAYLAQLPADALKIDRSFVTTMRDRPESTTIISSIISLAHALRMRVIAEGVETEEQARQLRLLQCDELQGYAFGRPAPWDECFAERR